MQFPGETIGSRPRAPSEAGWDIQRLFNTIRMSSSSPSCSGDAPAVSHLLGRRAKIHVDNMPSPCLFMRRYCCIPAKYLGTILSSSSRHQPLFVRSAPVSLPNERAQSQKCRSTSAVAVLKPPSEPYSAHTLRRRRQRANMARVLSHVFVLASESAIVDISHPHGLPQTSSSPPTYYH